VRETRESLHMSRQVFAFRLGVKPRTLERWEQGRSKPNKQAAALICFGEPPELVGQVDERGEPPPHATLPQDAEVVLLVGKVALVTGAADEGLEAVAVSVVGVGRSHGRRGSGAAWKALLLVVGDDAIGDVDRIAELSLGETA
jgi:transcriptional regulator with XRE-family HTH domain